jgi:endoglycosylceramidase
MTLHTDGGFLRDEAGRVVLLRGANVSGRSKTPPFLPFDDPKWFDALAQWGMNAIRLLVTWEAIEPERGTYDDRYLAKIGALARAAGERGLHVVVDFHQDLFSRSFGGDGAPAWAVTRRGRAATGREWFWYYGMSSGVQQSFAAFWRDEHGLRTAFLDTVAHTMRALADVDAIVGYDLFNEPMAPLVEVVRGRFEREWLLDFHRACVRLRDAHAPGRVLFVEPTPLVAFGAPTSLGELEGRDIAYAPHLYDATALLASRFLPRLSTFPRALAAVASTSRARKWPLVIGELGVLNGVALADRMMEDQCSRLDRAFASWLVWHYNPTDVDWNAEDASIVEPGGAERPWTPALVRPFPRALAGTPVRWESRPDRTWTLEYDAHGSAPTELTIPARWCRAPRIAITGGEAQDARTPRNGPLGNAHAPSLEIRADPGARVRVELRR